MINTNCPDQGSHWENAQQALGFPLNYHPTPDEMEAIDALAEAEYKVCEGH